ncbi:MAG TPA: phage tail protein [Kofleriaceae bacterium]|nr:phage tail protein [Kofleriaceae bacterium]
MASNSPPNKSTTRKDPLPVFCFYVSIPKLMADNDKAFFKSVSGLRYETEVVPVRAGGANDTTFNLPGATKWSPLVLKQGFTQGSKLIEWRQKWIDGSEMTRVDGSIIQLNTAMQPMAQWDFVRGWPSKWEMGDFDASKNELAIESIEICHDGLKFKPVG